MIKHHVDKDILYIEVSGRIDASNASAVEEEIASIKGNNMEKHTVIDADNLQYISSAGLRVILRLRKDDAELAIINVSPEVYEVFDMTGFTDMVRIEKAYRRLSIEGCELLGKGANGAVYRYDDETIVKTYHNKDSLPEIQQERENARKAFVHGINTAIPYGIVRVGDGYGTVTELLKAKSISKMMKESPDDLDEAVKYYVDMVKGIHAIEVEPDEVPDAKVTVVDWARFLEPHLPAESYQKLVSLVDAIPQQNTLLHGDYHTNNIMIQNGEALLIDMDTLSCGHPIIEFASMFNAFVGFSELDHENTKAFLGCTFETAGKFWRKAIAAYFDNADEEFISSIETKASIIGYTRLLRRAIRRPDEEGSAQIIENSRKKLIENLEKVDTLLF